MKLAKNHNELRRITGIALSIFVFCWYFLIADAQTVYYQEQTQMFRFAFDYLGSYLARPGGLSLYAGAFLTQFFYWPVVGALIYTALFLLFAFLFKLVMLRFAAGARSLFLAFVPALLFLPASTNLQFCIGEEIAVVVPLAAFLLLQRMPRRQSLYLLPIALALLYLIAGGNYLITVALLLLADCRKPHIAKGFLLALAASLLFPLLAWRFLFLNTLNECYWAVTPFVRSGSYFLNFGAVTWLLILMLPFAGLILSKLKHKAFGIRLVRVVDVAACMVCAVLLYKSYLPAGENMIRMEREAAAGRWERLFQIAQESATSPYKCFYLNLALQQSGRMADEMFRHDQIGVQGLVLDANDDYAAAMMSNFFYRLGVMNEAHRLAYEALVSYSTYKEPDVRDIKRLYQCALQMNKTALGNKYQQFLQQTLFYKPGVTEIEQAIALKDLLIRNQAEVFNSILQANPHHRMAFDYLMAYYMLKRDLARAKSCYDTWFNGMGYTSIPRHYAELLTLYCRVNNLDDSFYEKYPVPREIREQFDIMETLLQYAKDHSDGYTLLEQRFLKTYWFYAYFPLTEKKAAPEPEKTIN